MAKIVKLTVAQQRTWNRNTCLIVGDDGSIVREATVREVQALSELSTRARRTGRTQTAQLKRDGAVVAELSSEPKKLGDGVATTEMIDGHQLTTGRDRIRKEMLEAHGECQIRRPSGQYLAAVRDPKQSRPTSKDAARTAPKPEHCQCKDWANREEGRHHKVCGFNKFAAPEERAVEAGGKLDNETLEIIEPEPQREQPTGSILHTVQTGGVQMIAPGKDDRPPREPTRVHREPPVKAKPVEEVVFEGDEEKPKPTPEESMVLVNLKGAPRVFRAASADEIAQAEANFEDRQVMSITLGMRDYLVMSRKEADDLMSKTETAE